MSSWVKSRSPRCSTRATLLASRVRPLLLRYASARRVAAMAQPLSAAAASQAASTCAAPPSFSVVMLGDTMLGRLVDEKLAVLQAQGEPPAAVLGDTLPLIRAADVRILNLECALTDHPVRWTQTPKMFHFRSSPAHSVPVLAAAGVHGVALSNNHVLDYNEPGLHDTLRTLDSAGIARAGAGASLEEARAPGWMSVKVGSRCVRIALLGMADHPDEWCADGATPGINLFYPFPSPDALAWARAAAAAARAQGADLVVLSAHYGGNWVLRPPEAVRAFTHALMESSDVDVFFGNSAHVAQGVEIHAGKLIAYQAGDFLDDYAIDSQWHNDWGAALTARFSLLDDATSTVARARLASVEIAPLLLSFAHTRIAPPGAPVTRAIAARMQKLSAQLGTTLSVDAHTGVLRWPA